MPVTVIHAKNDAQADFTGTATVFNSTGGTTTMLATDLVRPSDWNSAHNLTLSLSASELTAALNFGSGLFSTTASSGISVGILSDAYFEPFALPNTNSTLSAPGIGTWYIDGPYVLPNGLGKGQINLPVTNAGGFLNGAVLSAAVTGSVSKYQTLQQDIALYQQGAGASTSRLELLASARISFLATWSMAVSSTSSNDVRATVGLTLSFPSQFDVNGAVTYGTTSQSGSLLVAVSTMVSSSVNSLISTAVAFLSGARMDIIPLSTVIQPGEYWFAHMFSSTSSTTGTGYGGGTAFSTQSRLGLLENAMNAYKRLGVSVSNSTTNVQPFHGYLATTTSGASAIINVTDVRGTTGRAYWNYQVSTY